MCSSTNSNNSCDKTMILPTSDLGQDRAPILTEGDHRHGNQNQEGAKSAVLIPINIGRPGGSIGNLGTF